MLFHPSLARHVFPCAPKIMGKQLQPFSIWHWRLLLALESPFFSEDADISFGDLQIALHLCVIPALAPVRRLTPSPWRCRLTRGIYGRTWLLGAREFNRYVREACKGPRYFTDLLSPGKPVNTSQPDYLIEKLAIAGYPREDVWRMTPGRARWLLCTLEEAHGHHQEIVTPVTVKEAHEAGHFEYELD